MLVHYVPVLFQFLFPGYVWHRSRKEKAVYLTFDDGPVPEVTDFVLEELEKRQMKATFFMVGDNVAKHLSLAVKVRDQGHQIGNHTYNHLNGRLHPSEEYLDNVKQCQSILSEKLGVDTTLFRAPYGRLKREQRILISRTHQIIMWDVLAGDFHPQQTPARCLAKIKQHTHNGSIILFHDQEKTKEMIFSVLPEFLDFIQVEGYHANVL